MNEKTSSSRVSTILVTGDLVLDHHLYEGTRPDPQQQHERALITVVEWGGASLLCRLLQHAELEKKIVALWDSRIKAHKAARKSNPSAPELKEPSRPSPDDEDLKTIPTEIATHLAWGDLPQPDALGCFPTPICTAHGYALFSPTPRSPKDSQPVWRVSKALGYGDSRSGSALASPPLAKNLPPHPDVVCLDDAGIGFRNLPAAESKAWCLPGRAAPWIVLKLSGDLQHGRLWDELARRNDLTRASSSSSPPSNSGSPTSASAPAFRGNAVSSTCSLNCSTTRPSTV